MLKQSMVGITVSTKSPVCAFRRLQAQKRSQKDVKQFLAVLQVTTLLVPSNFLRGKYFRLTGFSQI